MFAERRFKSRISNLEKSFKGLELKYLLFRQRLENQGANNALIIDLKHHEKLELQSIRGNIAKEKNSYWTSFAEREGIELPPLDEESMWTKDHDDEQMILTNRAIVRIRNAAEEKRQKKWEFFLKFVVPIATGVSGASAFIIKMFTES